MAIIDVLADIAPQFGPLDQALRERFIGYAENQVDQEEFAADYDLAVANLAAHMLTLSQERKGGAGGAVSQLREGDLSIFYQIPTDIEGTLSQTKYGIEFLRIRNLHIIPVLVACTT